MVCILCCTEIEDELNLGQFMHSDGVTVHYHCLLFASLMVQKGGDDEGILGFMPADIHKEAERGKRNKCSYCGRKGATISCCVRKCRYIFHLPCSVQKGSLHQYYENFRSYCHMHKRKQKVPKIYYKDKLECLICLSEVCGMPGKDQLWSPCCKNVWFHKTCVQRLALSAGYLFKCPLCNNDDLFVKEMKNQGIFVPSRDASWELEENAYSDLLSQYSHCDAKKCLCPKGRAYSAAAVDRIWHIILCKTCGSQGCHRHCMKKFSKSQWEWECPDCAEISKLAQFDNREIEEEDVFQDGISSPVQDLTEPTCSTSLAEYASDDSASSSQVNFLVNTNSEEEPCSEVDSGEFYSYNDVSNEENAELFDSCYVSVPEEINFHDEDHIFSNEETNISRTSSLSDEFMLGNSTKMLLTDDSDSKNVVVSSTTENDSNPLVYSSVTVSQPSSIIVSLGEFLEQKNLTQKVVSIDDTCERDNVEKVFFSGQLHRGKKLSSVAATDVPQTENQDVFSLQLKLQENVGVQILESHQGKKAWGSCNEETNTSHPQLINVGIQALESNQEGRTWSNCNNQVDTSISQLTSYTGYAEHAPTTVNNSHCTHSIGNNKSIFSSNIFYDKNTVESHNCVTDPFSRFIQKSHPSFRETTVVQSWPSEVTLQSPLSGKDACLSKTSPPLIEREGLLQNTDVISYDQEEKMVHDSFLRATLNGIKDINKSTFQKNNTNGGKEVIEVNDDIEVIDVNSDPEIIEVDDTVEPRVVFNVDENLIEID